MIYVVIMQTVVVMIEVGFIIALFLHYKKTKLFPSLTLIFLFITFFMNNSLFLLTFLIPNTKADLALIIMNLRVGFWFISLPILFLFLESILTEKHSFNFILFCLYSSFLIGLLVGSPLHVNLSAENIWMVDFTPKTLGFIVFYLFYTLVVILNQSIKIRRSQKNRRNHVKGNLFIFGFIIAFFGEGLTKTLKIQYFREIFLIIGFSLSAYIYLSDPKEIFIDHVKIFQIRILDVDSGMSIFKWGEEIQILEQDFYASTIIQKYVARTNTNIKRLDFGDRIFLFDYVSINGRNLTIAVLVNRVFLGIGNILHFILIRFARKFAAELEEKADDLKKYDVFSIELKQLFKLLPFELI